jgi:predicted acyl esterase
MLKGGAQAAALCAISLALGVFGSAEPGRVTPFPPMEEKVVKVPMRDGIHLSTHVYKLPGTAKLPTILLRTPYDKEKAFNHRFFVERGYAVVVCRMCAAVMTRKARSAR